VDALNKTISIAARSAVLGAVLLGAAVSIACTEEPLPGAYRTAKAALESGDAAKTVAILEPRLPEAQGEQRGAVLFTLGVALLKLDRPADAEQRLTEAKALFENQPKLAELWALLGDARAAQSKPREAAQAYDESVRAGAATPDGSIVRYASARGAELAAADFLLKGDALSAVGRLRDAAELSADRIPTIQVRLGEIVGNRKLRGEATAAAIFTLGEIEQRSGRLPEAIAYYQRVFVSWLKYPAWVARSYVRAAECFDKLGRRKDAIAHLYEMMRKAERLRDQPEFTEGRRKLREWTPPP
jgi:tetratricopeptide (TPR) repeat protein